MSLQQCFLLPVFFFFFFWWVWNVLEQFCCCLTLLDHFQMLKCSVYVWFVECHQWRVAVVPSVWLRQRQRKINEKKNWQTRGEKRKIEILKALNQNTINSDLLFFFYRFVVFFSTNSEVLDIVLYSMRRNMEKM